MYEQNESVLEEIIYNPIVERFYTSIWIRKSNADVWLGVSIAHSMFTFIILWVETGYWPWWMFIILWIATEISIFCTSIALRVRGVQDRTLAFDTIYWAHVTFSTHASVIGALHVLDADAWSTLITTTIVGLNLYAPHWNAIRTNMIQLKRWTGPSEVRFFSTTGAVCFAPFHELLKDTVYGSFLAVMLSFLLLPSIFVYVWRAVEYTIDRKSVFVIAMHFLLSAIPSFGMMWWTWRDEWLAEAVPVTFAGILILVNMDMVARAHFDRRYNNRSTLFTPLDLMPFFGVADSYFCFLSQPLSVIVIYTASFVLTCLFLVRVSLSSDLL